MRCRPKTAIPDNGEKKPPFLTGIGIRQGCDPPKNYRTVNINFIIRKGGKSIEKPEGLKREVTKYYKYNVKKA